MEVGSRNFQNVGANREADKVFNPEFFAPPSAGTVAADVISSAPSSAPSSVGIADLSGINATVSSAAGTDTATVPATSFTFPPLTNDLNSAPPDTEYPSFTSFDSVPSQAEIEPALEEETQQGTVLEAFDDMVVLKDGMVTSASLSYERIQATGGHVQESQEAAASQEAVASGTEKTTPEAVGTQASAEGSMDVSPEVSIGMRTEASPTQEPAEGLALEPETDVTKDSISEVLIMQETVVEDVPLPVETVGGQPLVEEQPSHEEIITEDVSIPEAGTGEPETALNETPAISSELSPENPPEEDFPSEKLPEGEPPSEKPPEGDPPSEKPPEVEIFSEVQPVRELPIELSDGEDTQQEPAVDEYDVTEQDIQAIKGQKVLKKFGKKDFVGDVIDYDPETKWFKIVYEDGDEEDLEFIEIKPLLVAPGTTPASSSKKKRPRTDGDADEENKKSSKKPKKMVVESSKSGSRKKSKDGGKQVSKKQKGRSSGAKNVSKSPAKPISKSPGSKLKSTKTSSATKKIRKAETKSPGKQEEKVKPKTKSEEGSDPTAAKSPGKSSKKKRAAKSGTRTPNSSIGGSSKSTKNSKVSGGSDSRSSKPKSTGKVTRLADSPAKEKGKTGQNLKLGAGVKVEDTPKNSKVGAKRKAVVEEAVQGTSKRLKKGVTEKDTVPGREIDRVGEATFIGKPVRKEFDGTFYDGVVVGYDKKTKYFKVKYDDGDQEDLEWRELELILVSEGKSDVDTEAKPAKVSLLSTLMSQEKKTGRSSAKKRKSTW